MFVYINYHVILLTEKGGHRGNKPLYCIDYPGVKDMVLYFNVIPKIIDTLIAQYLLFFEMLIIMIGV